MYRPTHITGFFGALILMLCIQDSHAGSATWKRNARSGDWNTKTNWMPATVPNGLADTATFGLSRTTDVSFSASAEVNAIIFTSSATNPYTITAGVGLTLTISGVGITNNSGTTQTFITAVNGAGNKGEVFFTNSATAGTATITNRGSAVGGFLFGGETKFGSNSTAGNAIITNNGGTSASFNVFGGATFFHDASTAANATITNNGGATNLSGGSTRFFDSSTAANGTFNNNGSAVREVLAGFGSTLFNGTSTAANGTFNNNGGTVFGTSGGRTTFFDSSTAASGTFINTGGTARGTGGGVVFFVGFDLAHQPTAASGTFINTGGTARDTGGGSVDFLGFATAANGTFTNNGGVVNGAQGGRTGFNGSSTAANGIFTNNGGMVNGAQGGRTNFTHTSTTAANGIFTNNGGMASGAQGGTTSFGVSSMAGNGRFTNNGGAVSGAQGGFTEFFEHSTADHGIFTNNGGAVSGASGGSTEFGSASKPLVNGISTAGSGTFINNGATVSGALGGSTSFFQLSTAGSATLIANGGTNGGQGGHILFEGASRGGGSRIELFGNGNLDISGHVPRNPLLPNSVTVGSIEGDGSVFLGANNLTVGRNNLSTAFSGVIQDGGQNGGTGGSLRKIDSGTLILSGANTYSGNTYIGISSTNSKSGVLQLDGSIASNTFVGGRSALAGVGTVFGNVTNANGGTVSPGDGLGALTVSNNYTQTQWSSLLIQIAGPNPDEVDVLNVLGNASLTGNLHPVLLNGFIPTIGESFTFLDSAALTGAFSRIQNQVFDNGTKQWSVAYEGTNAVLTVGPNTIPDQASTLLLLTLGLLGVVTYRHGLPRKQA